MTSIPRHSHRPRESHSDQDRTLIHIVMGIAQHANCTGLHHHGEIEIHGELEPSLDKGTKNMAVRDLKI